MSNPILTTALSLLLVAIPGLAACGAEADHDHAGSNDHGQEHEHGQEHALAAPTSLTAAPAQGGVHLSWTDNSADEETFMVMRRTGSGAYADVGRTAPNVTQLHDTTVAGHGTYVYMVHALRGPTTSSPSNEVTVMLE